MLAGIKGNFLSYLQSIPEFFIIEPMFWRLPLNYPVGYVQVNHPF